MEALAASLDELLGLRLMRVFFSLSVAKRRKLLKYAETLSKEDVFRQG